MSSSPGSTSHRSSIPDETFDMCCIETPELTLGLDFIADVLSEADHSSKPIPKKLGVEIVESIVRWAWSQESYKRWATTKENAASVGLEVNNLNLCSSRKFKNFSALVTFCVLIQFSDLCLTRCSRFMTTTLKHSTEERRPRHLPSTVSFGRTSGKNLWTFCGAVRLPWW